MSISVSTSVFKLLSDKQFISRSSSNDILVVECKGDPNGFDFSHAKTTSYWCHQTTVGPGVFFRALEVWGVTIGGDKLKELANDFCLVSGQTFELWVNRQGLCYLRLQSEKMVRLRISDRFDWSKYGVKVPEVNTTTWTIYDTSNGTVLFPPRRLPSVYSDQAKKVDDDGNSEDYSSSSGWKKVVEEKGKEVASLKAALRALIN